jgi:hypothetical protein
VDAVNMMGAVMKRWFVVLRATDLQAAGGTNGVPWLHLGIPDRHCGLCGRAHG